MKTLKEHIQRVGEPLWKPYHEYGESEVECGDGLKYWPEDVEEQPAGVGLLHYVALRVRWRQATLFADGSEVKYFAVATNPWDWASQSVEWHHEEAGSVEALQEVLKNELAARVMPCGRFGVHAAWLRLAVRMCQAFCVNGFSVGSYFPGYTGCTSPETSFCSSVRLKRVGGR